MQTEEEVEQQTPDGGAPSSPEPPIETQIKVEEFEMSTPDDANLKGTALLKSLLSASTALSELVDEKMITTTEVTDEKLKLKKILYQSDQDEKDEDSTTPNGHSLNVSDGQIDDDDRRLVIDISDDEKDVQKSNGKSMPSLYASVEDENHRKALRPSTLDTSFVPARPHMRHLVRAHHSE